MINLNDFFSIFNWWIIFLIIGIIFLPLTFSVFNNFKDKGYIFSKILGMGIISYCIFLFGTLHILPFTKWSVVIILLIWTVINYRFFSNLNTIFIQLKNNWLIFIFEELMFLLALFYWSNIRTFAPDIHGLEKFMDFGFVNSILKATYFPPKDMWFTPFSINYYYFGHFITAVLTKLSAIPSNITYNLMLATLFAFTFSASFSIGANLISQLSPKRYTLYPIVGGFLTAFLTTFAGNLHTIYAFFKPYQNENPVPLWNLAFSPQTFPNAYWYPNATRFIYHTIHEFPIYSFVVSDLHGHVLDIPFVLLFVAILLSMNLKSQISNLKSQIPLIGFLLAIMYMTNIWDGLIYFLLVAIFLFYKQLRHTSSFPITTFVLGFIIISAIIFSLPFSLTFKPFASGIGILCAPKFLTNIGHLGPFLFEADHCQKSPWWQLFTLYGFFYFWIIAFIIFLISKLRVFKLNAKRYTLDANDSFILILAILATILIIVPEFIYAKDIYPAHYRANTMFKLVYQSFMLLSIASGYIIIRMMTGFKFWISKLLFLLITILLLCLVFIYPYFAINSYYGNLQTSFGLDGTAYLKKLYPSDYAGIAWINSHIQNQPVILEAQGDSYTDYARISSNTGLPTVLGWTVHEWLWRGTYDVPAPRISDVQNLYESNDLNLTKQLIKKYDIKLVFIGNMETQKYTKLNEVKFQKLGKLIFLQDQTKIYQL